MIKERTKESWARAKDGVQRTEAICKSRENGRLVWACLKRVCYTDAGFGASTEPSSVTGKSL